MRYRRFEVSFSEAGADRKQVVFAGSSEQAVQRVVDDVMKRCGYAPGIKGVRMVERS